MSDVYFGGFDSFEDVVSAFKLYPFQLKGIEILYANLYNEDYEAYEEYAHVIFRKDGKLYKVNGYNFPYWGFEDQWQPKNTTMLSLIIALTFQKMRKKFFDWL